MFEELFESSEETYRRKRCEAREAIREHKGREPTEKEIEDYLYTD
jgi:hypothetical protein